jgi:predicted  nucleic acid-binding Zn-ribbon protein
MNTIEAAKKRIEENNERIHLLAIRERSLQYWINDLENDIWRGKKPFDELKVELQNAMDSLKETYDEEFVLLVDNLALEKLIADPRWLD